MLLSAVNSPTHPNNSCSRRLQHTCLLHSDSNSFFLFLCLPKKKKICQSSKPPFYQAELKSRIKGSWCGYHNQRGIGLSNASPLTCVCNTCLLHSDSNSFFLFLFLTKNNNLPIVQTNPISNPSKSLNVPLTLAPPPIPVPVRCTHQRAGERTSQNI